MHMTTRPPFENFPQTPSSFGLWADFTSAGMASAFTSTLAASGTATVLSTEPGGAIRLSGAATTDDSGVNYQATHSGFGLVLGKEILFACRARFGESTSTDMPTQCEFAAGLSVQDTTTIASAPTDGIYFRKDDGDNLLDCVVRAGSAEVGLSTGAFTMAKDTWYSFAIRVTPDPSTSGKGTVTFYVDGASVASIQISSLPMAASAMFAPFAAFLSGNNLGTKYVDLDYLGAQQAR
jgi:hypothetical protein